MTKASIFTLATLLATMVSIGCNSDGTPATTADTSPSAFDLVTAKKEIEEVNRHFMDLVAKGDSVGIGNLFTTDAKLMFDGPAEAGRANIQTAFGHIIRSGITKVILKTNEVFGTEDLLAEDGDVTVYVDDKVVSEEKSLVLWKKEAGQWKIFRDMATSNALQ